MKVYTIKDIAAMAGVSVTTVSRVLNHRPDVNIATREKVEQIIRDCHFVGNTNARGLKQGNEVIGVVIRGRSNPFLSSLAEAILERADNVPDNFVTEYIDERADEFRTALRMTRQNHVKGLIFVGSLIDERVEAIRGLDIPMVFTTVNAESASLPRASSVAVDDRSMGRMVAEELLNNGHRRIAVFGSNPVAGDSLAMRFQGFCDAFTDRGLSYDRTLYRETRFSFEAGYDVARTFFAERPDTTALFAMSDTVAVGAIRALRDLGMSVPEDVSVVGFDGVDIGRFTLPRLTTVEQPVEEIARRSVNLLLDMMEKDAAPRHILVEASFRRRESVAQCVRA
ncbi:MAG: LacI family DNA-binding transcriptional regulator [Clostridia bacterium]|nr:LacI family DNA-binding transcriptional regulator [Clostridia bacterium]